MSWTLGVPPEVPDYSYLDNVFYQDRIGRMKTPSIALLIALVFIRVVILAAIPTVANGARGNS